MFIGFKVIYWEWTVNSFIEIIDEYRRQGVKQVKPSSVAWQIQHTFQIISAKLPRQFVLLVHPWFLFFSLHVYKQEQSIWARSNSKEFLHKHDLILFKNMFANWAHFVSQSLTFSSSRRDSLWVHRFEKQTKQRQNFWCECQFQHVIKCCDHRWRTRIKATCKDSSHFDVKVPFLLLSDCSIWVLSMCARRHTNRRNKHRTLDWIAEGFRDRKAAFVLDWASWYSNFISTRMEFTSFSHT